MCIEKALPDILKMLLLYDLTIDAPDDEGFYPLHWIFGDTTTEVVKLLLDRGSRLDITGGTHSITPLGQAVSKGSVEVIKYLISIGADVNHRERNDLTALHRGCRLDSLNSPDIVRLILESGADINAASTGYDGTPFQATLHLHSVDSTRITSTIRLLLDHPKFLVNSVSPWWGANINVACLAMGMDVVEELLQAGAKVDSKDRAGRQSIHFSSYREVAFVQRLVKTGASLDAKDAMGRTLLHIAVLGGHLDLVKYIIQERKEFANARDANDWTPLLWAMGDCSLWGVDDQSETQEAIIKELLECGASPLAQGYGHDRTWTALKLARYLGLGEDITKLVTPTENQLGALDPSEQSRWQHEIGEEWGVAATYYMYCDFCFGVSTHPSCFCVIAIQHT